MKKTILSLVMLVMLVMCGNVWCGQLGLPREQIALPAVQGNHLICIWDETAEQWYQVHQSYDHSGSYTFELPEWGKWYWIGLWDEASGEYVYGKWIGHFLTD